MIYRPKNKNRHIGSKIFFGVLILLAIFRIFNISFFITLFDAPVHYILESHTIFLQPFKNSIVYLKDKKDLQNQIAILKQENINLKIQTISEQTMMQEFEVFKNQFASTTISNTIAKVILKPPFLPFDTLTIAGDLSNFEIGNFVFYSSILIGRLVEKDNSCAKVELFSTPDKITPITVHGTQFEAKGLGGGRYVFEVSKEFEISQGDPIVFPEQQLMIIGVVELIESKEADLFKKIYFNVPIPLESLSYVTIGK